MSNAGLYKISCKKWKDIDLKNFLEIDYWDTLEHLCKTTWLNIPKQHKRVQSRKTFNENTRVAMWTLNALFLGAIEEYENRIEKNEKNIKNLALMFEMYIINRENFKKKGRKEILKWKV